MLAYPIAAFGLLLLVVSPTLSREFSCYECSDCRSELDYLPRKANCRACGKTVQFRDDEAIRTSRYCLGRCTPHDEVIHGYGTKKFCCEGELCNGASAREATALLFTCALVISFLL